MKRGVPVTTAFLLALAFLAACGGSAPPDTPGGATGPASQPQQQGQDIAVGIRCENDGVFTLDGYYLFQSEIDSAFPDREYDFDEIPTCDLGWSGGTPGYDVSATVGIYGYSAKDWASGRSADLAIVPMPPGTYEVQVEVVDSAGLRGVASRTIVWEWRFESNRPGLNVDITKPYVPITGFPGPDYVPRVVVEVGQEVELEALTARALFGGYVPGARDVLSREGLSTDSDTVAFIGEFIGDLLAENIPIKGNSAIVEWDFGDGVTQTESLTWKTQPFKEHERSLTQRHTFEEPGVYEATVTVTDEGLQRVATETLLVDVRGDDAAEPTAVATPTAVAQDRVPVARWTLVATNINPEGLPLETEYISPTPTPVPPGGDQRERREITVATDLFTTGTISEGSMSYSQRKVNRSKISGEIYREFNYTLTFSFDSPPPEFIRYNTGNEPIKLQVNGVLSLSESGELPAGVRAVIESPSATFRYGISLSSTLFSASLNLDAENPEGSAVYTLPAPQKVSEEEFRFYAYINNCEGCVVEWVYRVVALPSDD